MKLRLRRLVVVLLLSAFPIALENAYAAESTGFQLNPSLAVHYESEYALQTHDGHGQKFQSRLEGELLLDPAQSVQFVTRIRITAEILDNIDPGDFNGASYSRGTKPIAYPGVSEIEIREVFFQWSQGPARLRLGKQQLTWGEADGIKVLDILNPQDFREYILPKFADSRIPLWAVRFDLELHDLAKRIGIEGIARGTSLQLLFVPDPSVHNIPDLEDLGANHDAPYAPTSDRIVPKPPTDFASAVDFEAAYSRRDWDAAGFDAGWRLSIPVAEIDAAIYYLWHVDDYPVISYGPARLVLIGSNLLLRVPVSLRNRRYHMAGASASTAIGDWVLRAEMSYAFDREVSQIYSVPPTVINDIDEQIGKSDDIAWVLGVDWFGPSNVFLSAQVFQNVLAQHSNSMLRRKVETAMTLFARRKFFNERMSAELMLILGINDGDGLIRPRLDYEWSDNISIWISGDVFYGDKNGYFGQFDRNDRVTLGLSLGWTSD